jgi:hypothetical protein
MGYEHGTMDMNYEEAGRPHEFKAVMLNVYRAKGGVGERVAGTIQPLETLSVQPPLGTPGTTGQFARDGMNFCACTVGWSAGAATREKFVLPAD